MAAAAHGAPAVIVMPKDAPQLKIDNPRAVGAAGVLYDRAGGEIREEVGGTIAQERGLPLIRPYDAPQVIAGQGTTGLEIAAQAAELGVTSGDVLVCCGGGGLSAGIALALEAEAPAMRVRTAEPEGFDDVARSLASGQRESNSRQSGSLCDAIITPSPGELTFPIMSRLCGPGLVVSEDQALEAMALAFKRLKIVVEPGGAVALAAALFHGDQIEGEAVVAVCTGGNVDADVFAQALAKHG
jgi:threonine dehydratase